MAKRKSRNKIDKAEVDFFKPLNVLLLGGPDDPCFGKFHSLKASECQRCGDSELCSIKMMQQMKGTRAKEEKKQPFKDQEEVFILVENYLKSKMTPGKLYAIRLLIQNIQKKFLCKTPKEAENLLKKTYKFSGKFKKTNNHLWQQK